MGQMTRTEFHTEINRALGRTFGTSILDVWLNLGYYEVLGAQDFEDTYGEQSFSLAVADNTETLAADLLAVRFVANTTDKIMLVRKSKESFSMIDETDGPPLFYTRKARTLYVVPKPLVSTAIVVGYTKEMPKLSATVTVTAIPAAWDSVVLAFAVSWGLRLLNEEQRALSWWQTAVMVARTKITEAEMVPSAFNAPVRVATDLDELQDFRDD